MKSSKILRMLETLPVNELNEFGRYLRTDFFNRREILVQYFDFFNAYIKGRRTSLDKETLYRRLFKDELPRYQKMSAKAQTAHLRKRMDGISYELKNHLESYLIWKQSQEKSFARDRILLAALEDRRADEFYFSTFSRLESEYQSRNQSLNHFLYAYLLRQDAHEHPGFERWNIAESDISQVQALLDIFYVAVKLINAWIQILQDHIFNRPTEILLLNEILAGADLPPFKGNLYIDCYRRAILDFQNDAFNMATGDFLRSRIVPQLDGMPQEDQIGLFNLMLNYHMLVETQSNEEKQAHAARFELMQLGLENGYLLRNGTISYADFYNLVTYSLELDMLDWGEAFVDQYSSLLPESVRLPATTLALARLKMGRQEFRKALEILTEKQEFTSEFDQMVERFLRIKCSYELSEFEYLEHLLESTRKFTARLKSVGESYQAQSQQFIRLTRRLLRARQQTDSQPLARQVLESLDTEVRPASMEWLRAKVEEILGE